MPEIDTNPLHHSEQQEQTEPTSLRDLARELDRPREKLTPSQRYPNETPDGDLILTPDENGYRPEIEQPKYRSTEAAYEARQQQRQDADVQQYEDQKQYLDQSEEQHRTTVRDTANLSTDDEKQRHANYLRAYQQAQQDAARQLAIEQQAAREVADHRANGRYAAAAIIEQQVMALRAPVVEKAQEVQRKGQQWADYGTAKQKAALQQEVLSTCPGLIDPGTRTAFKRWLVREHRIPLSVVENEWSPMVIGEAYKAFEKHEGERYDKLARAKIASERDIITRGAGSQTSSKAARDALKAGGRMDDALAFLDLRRRERRYGL